MVKWFTVKQGNSNVGETEIESKVPLMSNKLNKLLKPISNITELFQERAFDGIIQRVLQYFFLLSVKLHTSAKRDR